MAAGTMATAAGAAVVLYYVLSRRLSRKAEEDSEDHGGGSDVSKSSRSVRRRRLSRRPAQAPATLLESIVTLSETLRFTYSETFGKWPIGDLAFGINYFMRKQGNLAVASVYAGSDSVQLKGDEIIVELYELLRLLTLCMLFSKKPFPVFLDSAGFSLDDVLIQKPKAGLLKPAFTIIRDTQSKCLLLLIRGTHSIKDTLTAATGAVVPFHHSVLNDGGISNLVLGYAHCGMVAAARWIAKLCTPTLLKALDEFPDFKVKVVGHSLGGGTAALLTYILREQKEFSSSTCVTFAPAACMTWELAESGKHFITTIINGSDLVPTFSTSSIDDLRSEVTASSWLNDLRDQVEHTKVLNVVYRSATALGSRLPSISSARARVAGAGAILWPVTSSTQVVMRRAQSVAEAVVRTRSSLSSWSCMSARRRNVGPSLNSKSEDLSEASVISARNTESVMTEEVIVEPMLKDENTSSSGGSGHDDTDEEEPLLPANQDITATAVDELTEGQLWYELEKELQKQDNVMNIDAQEEEAAAAKEITEEESQIVDAAAECSSSSITTSDNLDSHRFYPPGRIMHIVPVPSSDESNSNSNSDDPIEEHVCLYETPRELYSKLRLSRTMINDHYMPMYKKMMELLIRELEKDKDSSCNILN
ncbi:sn1-specific diacylglycerol lipase alpha [Vigna unguiculata]|uniref:Sn1-specific diacylglycerol lipase alpha n=1 Tax=Vigna unguiculata TaxID=3917 RepID=A0A4D6NK49_VIGUN|nr:sn1-specific diacylglycerol lipase alpha [Vigna unguiculata]